MIIKKFQATKIHGYLNFNVKLNPDITFLTGINGAGKTSVVSGITSLITPSFPMLANTIFETMSVDIEDSNRKLSIKATKEHDQINLSVSTIEKALKFNVFPGDPNEPIYRVREKETDYYREIEAQNIAHPVLKEIKSFPAPMLLGIERRAQDTGLAEDRFLYQPVRKRPRSAYSSFLSLSILEACALAEQSYRKVQAEQRQLTDKLRKYLLLSVLKYQEVKEESKLTLPDLREKDVENSKRIIKTVSRELDIPPDVIEKQLDSFFKKLRQIVDRMPKKNKKLSSAISSPQELEQMQAVYEWVVNKPQFDRFIDILNHFERHVNESKRASESINTYTECVNQFLLDSQKQISFDATGNLIVRIDNSFDGSITSLSSGESHIVVMITHLAFNPAAQKANVFIVDEPELSLHVRWQELFVKSIRAVNKNIQLILATHSPSIILDDIDHCVDLSRRES